jgi:hypothetical protein
MRNAPILLTGITLHFLLLAGCGGGGGSKQTSSLGPTSGTLSVTPASASVETFGTQQFTAASNGQATSGVTWEVNGTAGGSQQFGFISASGLYIAPGSAPTKSDGSGGSTTDNVTISITAVSTGSASVTGTATVTIMPVNRNAQSGAVQLGTSGGNAHDSVTSGNKITCCGGTLGSLITRSGTQYILSANHVLARSDAASAGDAIIQPALVDANCGTSGTQTIANLSQFYNMETGSLPKIDAAIAQVVSGKVDPSGNILLLGASADSNGIPVAGAPAQGAGLPETSSLISRGVAKSGRSTGLTCASIAAINTATSVSYTTNCDGSGTKFSVNYTNQVDILGGSFSGNGDSGSLIVTSDTTEAVALLYAGSDTDTVGNPIGAVLNFFSTSGPATLVGGGTHAVVGCSLPQKPASAAASANVSAPESAATNEALQQATAVRDAHAHELFAYPEVQAVGVGNSYDNPKDAAIVFFVIKGQPHADIPRQVEGVRTRIVEGDLFAKRGVVSAEDSTLLEQSAAPRQQVYPISEPEYQRAKVVHAVHVNELMSQPGVQGVGITSSVDSPGEAALMIFLIRGASHPTIPAVIDGLRTRVRESSRFQGGSRSGTSHGGCSLPRPLVTRSHPLLAMSSATQR